MMGASFDYTVELENAKMRLQKLKEKLKLRAMLRRGEFSGQKDQDPSKVFHTLGGSEMTDAEQASPDLLPQLIARYLLGQEINLPLDSQALQNKLSAPEWEPLFQQALRAAGNPTLDQVLADMAETELPGIKVGEIEVGGKKRTSVLQIDRARLAGLAGDLALAAGLGAPAVPGPPPAPGPGNIPGPRPPPLGSFPMPGMHPAQFGGPQGGPPFGQGGPGPGGFNMPGPGPGFGPGPHGGNFGPGGMMMPGPPPMPGMGHMGPPHMGPGMRGDLPMGNPPGPMGMGPGAMMFPPGPPAPPPGPPPNPKPGDLLEALLSRPTAAQRDKVGKGEELHKILQAPTAAEKAVVKKFQNAGGPAVRGVCPHLTKADCCRANMKPFPCHQVHFRPVIFPWTNPAKGNCSFLDTCRNLNRCDHIHYELDDKPADFDNFASPNGTKKPPVPSYLQALPEAQWLKVDIRTFDMSVLGKFGVIMADPPWEIHQDLPYGTMQDEEMRQMKIGDLQDDGVIFLWVTGRAMELGRECLIKWGYNRVDELIWVKTNQLHRLIRTGRTGHWLNHSKEHCLVGIKGNPSINRNIECDVVVSEVRQTSRKPDEMYSLLERISPGTRKVEIFARSHNLRPGWVSLGNQLPGIKIVDPEMLARYEGRYGPISESDKAEAAAFDPSTIPP